MARIFSASSINLYKQCPRKWFYKYIKKLPEPPSIYTVRGNIVHSVLEHFFKKKASDLKDYNKQVKRTIDLLLDKFWIEYKDKLKELNMPFDELNNYYVESRDMLNNWVQRYITQIEELLKQGKTFEEAYEELKPKAEEYLRDEELRLQGYVDALYISPNNEIRVVDYKTSRKDIITPEYALQAGVYAVLIEKIKGKAPNVVTFDFLKGELRDVEVNEELLKNTKFEVEQIAESTKTEDITEYKKKPSGLCRWSNERGSGQCAFYEICKPNQ